MVWGIKELPNYIRSDSTILIVEDDYDCFILLKCLLKPLSVKIIHSIRGDEAIDAFKANAEIILVLMDIKIPILNGYEITRIIKSLKPEIPVIAISASVFARNRQKALDAGCDDFVEKPIIKENLLMLICRYLPFENLN
jgi:two-component system cell cycle response regulator DivK